MPHVSAVRRLGPFRHSHCRAAAHRPWSERSSGAQHLRSEEASVGWGGGAGLSVRVETRSRESVLERNEPAVVGRCAQGQVQNSGDQLGTRTHHPSNTEWPNYAFVSFSLVLMGKSCPWMVVSQPSPGSASVTAPRPIRLQHVSS